MRLLTLYKLSAILIVSFMLVSVLPDIVQAQTCTTPSAPTVTTPVNYCNNATATQLTASGTNLFWNTGNTSGTVGGTVPLNKLTYVDGQYSNKKTNFTTTAANVTITTIDYYIPANQAVSGLTLAIFNSSGTVIATSTTINSQGGLTSVTKVTNAFNFTLATAGNYSIGFSTGIGTIGSDSSSFPITETSGTINITGVSVVGARCFNNIQFTRNGSSTAPTPSTTIIGTTNYTVNQTVGGCISTNATIAVIVSAPPTVSGITTASCVGGSTGTITASASGGIAPYTFSLNSGTYQTSGTYSNLAAGNYPLSVKSNTGCVGSTTVLVSDYATSTDDQTATATGSWIGHMYDGTNFSNYVGHFTEAETFDELFGGNTVCFPIVSNSLPRSIYTETFSVKYRMNSTKKGLYTVDLGSDDGSRLTVDGTKLFDNWSDQVISTKASVLMSLNGASSLLFEYYENGGVNEVKFQNLTLLLANTLSTNTTQNICLGNTGLSISGDVYGTLPGGITLSGTGYQWSYSTTPGGVRANIAGATGAVFTPSTTTAPFNIAGTYYIYRNAILSSSNNISPTTYLATNESNAVTLIVTATPSATISYSGSPYCSNIATATVIQTGTAGGIYSSTAGLSIVAGTGAITPGTSTAGTNLVTYTIAAAGGCAVQTTTASVTITALPSATISYSGSPFCKSLVASQSVTQTGTAGGVYTSTTGLTINASSGAITPNTSTAGTYTVTYTMAAIGGCTAQTATVSITITTLPAATISYSGSPFCKSLVASQSVTQTGTTGGVYTSTTGLTIVAGTGAITPSTSTAGTYLVTYTMTAAGGCTVQTASVSVTITALPAATISYSGSPYCSNTGTASVTRTGTAGGTYSSTAGLSINSSTGDITLSSTPATYIVTYSVAASGGCSVYTTTASVQIFAINNNQIDYTNGTHGVICATPAENSTAILTAPSGNVFTTVGFASYGLPVGTCQAFTIGGCNATTSQSVTESYLLGNNTASIGANNTTFTDPCVGTVKQLYVQATYTQPICAGTTPGTISGTTPTGGNGVYTYLWEMSTTSSSIGFSAASGTNNTKDYVSGILSQNTWYRRTVLSGGCSNVSQVIQVTIIPQTTAAISYSASPYCSNGGTAAVTFSGTTGGAYSSTTGLVFSNTSTGQIDLAASTAGNYTISYTMAAAGGCSIQTVTTPVTITALPNAIITYSGTPYCTSIGSGQPVTQTGTTGGNYSSTTGLTILAGTGAITPGTSTAGTYTVSYTLAAVGGCALQTDTASVTIASLPSVSGIATLSCIGGSTGTITASASGGTSPYTFSLNAGTYQASGTYTNLAAGTYSLTAQSNTGCIGSTSVIVSEYATSTDDQNATATNSWIGHMYDGTNFSNYVGHFTETETFDESFGGSTTCFPIISNSVPRSIYTETFSVKYRMNSTKKGLYTFDLGSDDGSRLTVDGTMVYNNWTDQGMSTKSSVLMNLNGASSLLYEYYENGGGNEFKFQNLTLVLANTLSTNTIQNICLGNTGSAISGDIYGTLPAGITLSGTGYQWSYSVTAGGIRTNITGATGAAFTPSTSTSPFNIPGTYYIYRNAVLSSANNVLPNPYIVTNVSNAATITIAATSSATISYAGSPYCLTAATATVTQTGTAGGIYSSTAGLTINSSTGTITPNTSTAGTYTVTYTIAASGCAIPTASATITLSGPAISQIPTSNLIANYKFEANANDVTGYNNGVLQNSPAPTTDRFNNTNKAYSFDGSTQYVSTTNAYTNPTDFTISVWFKTNTTSGGKLIGFGNNQTGSSGTYDRHLYMNNAGQIYFGVFPGNVVTVNSALSYNDNNWHLASATLSATAGMALYIDGAIVGSNTATTSAQNYTGYWRIGYDNIGSWTSQPSSFYFAGSLDDILIYSRALNASEISTLYTSPDGAGNNGPVCTGSSIGLTATTLSGATYAWSGPNGFTSSAQNPTLTYSVAKTGIYSLNVTAAGCTATAYTIVTSSANAGQWTGNVNTDWATAGNWCSGSVPTTTTNVTIASSGITKMPSISSNVLCNNLTIIAGATVVVTGTGILNISGTISNSGTFTASSGTIDMNGTSLQTIPASAFAGNLVQHLTINNSAGVNLNGTLNIAGILLVSAGQFNTGGFLTLLSTATQTALIDGSGLGGVLGNVTMQGYLASAFGYHYISSPFQAALVSQLSNDINLSATFPSLYKYDENQLSAGWINYTDTTGLLNPMQGYTANFGNSTLPKIFDIQGVVNNGTVSTPTLYNHNNPYTLGFNLVGNPYPSPIDISILSGWTRTNIDNAFYFFNASTTDQYSGIYSSYVNGISTGIISTIIPAMQGFFIHVSDGTTFPVSGNLSFNNNARIRQLTPPIRALNGIDDRPLLRLCVQSVNDATLSDPMVVYFDDLAIPAYNKDLDALKLMNTDTKIPNLYAVSTDSTNLSISAIPNPGNSIKKVPLGLEINTSGWLLFNASTIKNIPAGMHIYLSDTQAGINQDLQSNPLYRLYLPVGKYKNRFFLTFNKGMVSTTPDTDTVATTEFKIYSTGKNLFVNSGYSKGTLVLMNMLGQVVLKQDISGIGNHEIKLQVSSGIYLATLVSDKARLTKKIFIRN